MSFTLPESIILQKWKPDIPNFLSSYRLVCVSVNRLTLHLRGFNTDFDSQRTMAPFSAKRQRRNSWLGTSTLDVRDASETSSESGVLSTLEMHDLYGPNDGGSDRKFQSLNGKGAVSSVSI